MPLDGHGNNNRVLSQVLVSSLIPAAGASVTHSGTMLIVQFILCL